MHNCKYRDHNILKSIQYPCNYRVNARSIRDNLCLKYDLEDEKKKIFSFFSPRIFAANLEIILFPLSISDRIGRGTKSITDRVKLSQWPDTRICAKQALSLSLSLFPKGERISPRCIFIRLAGFHFREIQAWAYLIASFLFWDAEYRTTTYLTVLNIAVSRGCVRRESSEKKAGWSFQLEIRTVKLHVEIASGFVTLSLTMIYPSGENSICFIMIVRCICFQD